MGTLEQQKEQNQENKELRSSKYEYKCVELPLFTYTDLKKKPNIALKVTEFINSNTVDGWEYYDTLTYYDALLSGCLGFKLRSKDLTKAHTALIFKREKEIK